MDTSYVDGAIKKKAKLTVAIGEDSRLRHPCVLESSAKFDNRLVQNPLSTFVASKKRNWRQSNNYVCNLVNYRLIKSVPSLFFHVPAHSSHNILSVATILYAIQTCLPRIHIFKGPVLVNKKDLEEGYAVRSKPVGDEGLLFDFGRARKHQMWMKGVMFDLDMVFLDDLMRVVGVVRNARANTTTPRSSMAPSRYVMEISAGKIVRDNIRTGHVVLFLMR